LNGAFDSFVLPGNTPARVNMALKPASLSRPHCLNALHTTKAHPHPTPPHPQPHRNTQMEAEARYCHYVERLPRMNRSIQTAGWQDRVAARAGGGLVQLQPLAAEGAAAFFHTSHLAN